MLFSRMVLFSAAAAGGSPTAGAACCGRVFVPVEPALLAGRIINLLWLTFLQAFSGLLRLPLNLDCPELFCLSANGLLFLALFLLNTCTLLGLTLFLFTGDLFGSVLLLGRRPMFLRLKSLLALKLLIASKCLGTLPLFLPLMFRRFLNLASAGGRQ